MFFIDNMSKLPIYEQIVEQVEKFVLTGVLKEGEALPSVRALSGELSINPNTIQKAYSELISRDIAFSVQGKGCYICEGASLSIEKAKRSEMDELKSAIAKLKLAGIGKEELLAAVDEIYN